MRQPDEPEPQRKAAAMTWWNIALMVLCLGICGLFAVFGGLAVWSAKGSVAAYKVDERNWKTLAGRGVPAQATVLRMTRQAQRLTKAGSYGNNQVAATDLVLEYVDAAGARHEVQVATFIETALLANFVEGRSVAIVHAPGQPDKVAIDRGRSPVEIPPSDLR